jgi:RecA-family ATPase
MSFFGSPKVGKSLLSLGLCEAIADPNIGHFLDLEIQTHGRVLIVQLDTPRRLWKTGYLSLIKSEIARHEIFIIDREMKDMPKNFDIRYPACQQWLRQEVDSVSPILVVVDTIRRMHKGNEDKSDIMEEIHSAFIEATQPAALMYIAHKKKAQVGEVGPGSIRGSTGFACAVDALINMSKSALYIEARSDAPEEIPIVQLDSGAWALDTTQDEKVSFINSLPETLPKMQKYKAVMEQFGVSQSTAQRLIRSLKNANG